MSESRSFAETNRSDQMWIVLGELEARCGQQGVQFDRTFTVDQQLLRLARGLRGRAAWPVD